MVIYSMTVSLDGFIAGPDGAIDWSAPDDELHRFHNEQTRELGAHLLGRRLYETMLYWETAEENPALPETEREFARIWKSLPRIVFSNTLDRVEGNARLAAGSVRDEVATLNTEPGKDLAVGGAALASSCIRLDLVDEYRLFVSPVVLGGGTPYFPALDDRIDLELIESRTFGSRVVYLRYRRGRGSASAGVLNDGGPALGTVPARASSSPGPTPPGGAGRGWRPARTRACRMFGVVGRGIAADVPQQGRVLPVDQPAAAMNAVRAAVGRGGKLGHVEHRTTTGRLLGADVDVGEIGGAYLVQPRAKQYRLPAVGDQAEPRPSAPPARANVALVSPAASLAGQVEVEAASRVELATHGPGRSRAEESTYQSRAWR